MEPDPTNANLALKYIITHVFCPLGLPSHDDHTFAHDLALAKAVVVATQAYTHVIPDACRSQWHSVERMLENLCTTVQSPKLNDSHVTAQLSAMNCGDVLTFFIRAQNAGVLFRRGRDVTVYASFELSPQAHSVITTKGKLVCSYPGPAIEIPNTVFDDSVFRSQLADFLVCMNEHKLDKDTGPSKANTLECHDTTHPRFITELLTGILRGVGHPATSVVRITKRIGDDVVASAKGSLRPWRRSPLWLLIRVAIQTTLEVSSQQSHNSYKIFILFFLTRLTEEAIQADLSNDLLYFMSSKISRRLRKFGPAAPAWLMEAALKTCSRAREVLDERWKVVQDTQRASPPHDFSELDVKRDLELSLSCSHEYLQQCLIDKETIPATPFEPKHRSRRTLDEFLSCDGTFFKHAGRAEHVLTLHNVEVAVEQNIDAWVDGVTDYGEACVKLDALADKYRLDAVKTYSGNPEQLSIMLLTILELWIALDKVALREIPILKDYDPEIRPTLLEQLLVCKTTSLRRLHQAHRYLSRRCSRSEPHSSVFSSTVSDDTFAIRYYNQSPALQDLKNRIEEDAVKELCKKTDQLKEANKQHAQLKLELNRLQHTYDKKTKRHSMGCRKCSVESELSGMRLGPYEWPLPRDELRAAIVVFELACPLTFGIWRTATFRFLSGLCPRPPRGKKPYLLHDYRPLLPYFVQHQRFQITLASDSRPLEHREIHIPATEDRICVPNSLTFFGFDTWNGIPVENAFRNVDIQRYCTFKLQDSSYSILQQYLNGTLHTSNDIVAGQANCPKDISVHEFLAFGHLRCGGSLQWLNILRELRDRSLSFRRPEVHLLIAQAIMQVGPILSTTKLKWHEELQQDAFGMALVDELETFVADVEANWLEGVAMNTVTLIIRRLITANPSRAVLDRAFRLLHAVRCKTFSWVRELSDKATRMPGDIELCGLLRDIAAICRSTFDIDATIKGSINSAEDVEILLSCAILIHDNMPSKVSTLSTYSKLLLDRDRHLSLMLENILYDAIPANLREHGIRLAIHRVWPGYRPGSEWKPLPPPNSCYLSCTTAPTAGECSQVVHLNLLDGSLLIDGKSLGRLPSAVIQHVLYDRLFGEQILDVLLSDLPGMDYVTRGLISGHQVHFALRGEDLVIRAKRGSVGHSEVMQLIPREKLERDFPAVLLKGHIHWLNISTSIMEFRPLEKPWGSPVDSESWFLDCTPGRYCMRKGHEYLVDVRSLSCAMISSLLRPLDAPHNLLVTASSTDPDLPLSTLKLAVALPRYGLSFYVDEDGELRSQNIQDMVHDENQSIGTLFGLVNQLVLRPKGRDNINSTELIPRCVLIPEGDISFRTDGHHVRVEVDTCGPALQRVTYQTYMVDTDLNTLTGNVSLTNKLYRAYLHALTSSGCNTDPLTGKSGTEEALRILRSASCLSITKFMSRDAELLQRIASLCPIHTLHKHYRNTQVANQLDLPARSQNHQLYLAAKDIKLHVEQLQLFHDGWETSGLKKFPFHDDHLFTRGLLRAQSLLPRETSVELPIQNHDAIYHSRDLVTSDSAEHRTFVAASTIFRWSIATASITITDLVDLVESWKGPLTKTAVSFSYNKSWLNPDFSAIWLNGYNALRESKKDLDRFKLLFSISSIAYGSEDQSHIIPTLLAFAMEPDFRAENQPADPQSGYDLSLGYQPTRRIISHIVKSCAHPFDLSPESHIPARQGERLQALGERQHDLYTDRLNVDANHVVDQVFSAWPAAPPTISLDSNAYDMNRLNSGILRLYKSYSRNDQLRQHLVRVSDILRVLGARSRPSDSLVCGLIYTFNPVFKPRLRAPPSVTLDQLIFTRKPPQVPLHGLRPHFGGAGLTPSSQSGLDTLERLIRTMQSGSSDVFQQQYASNLESSVRHLYDNLSRVSASQIIKEEPYDKEIALLADFHILCRDAVAKELARIKEILGPQNQSDLSLEQSGQWPHITMDTLFRCLSSTSPIRLSNAWKKSIIHLALLLLEYQRARRLLLYALNGHHDEFYKELENAGCDGWDPTQHPDWILIQLQSNFLIRRVQVDVANEMISPILKANTALQLNMGEGKSSVIVPIAVTELADGDQLVRVVVPKSLTNQTVQVLDSRLGSLVNRPIYYLPFSRSLSLSPEQVTTLQSLMTECVRKRGVMVVQPDHVLSLKLVTVEKQLSLDNVVASPLLNLQRWLHSFARDILDESDEILHVRYQVVYTIGCQQPMEGFPERWTTTQQVLSAVKKHAMSLCTTFNEGVECESGPPGSFPHIRILQPEATNALTSWIAQDALDGLLPDLNFHQLNCRVRDAILKFLTERDVSPLICKTVEEYAQQSTLWAGLLQLRGLLAMNILSFAFQNQRWRVDYGLAPKRTMLAVPYRAKDVPAPKAEFGHPDVAITLTCLSYYYRGLTEDQLRVSFQLLLNQDDPSFDYDIWVQDCDAVPIALRSYSGINLKSSEQWTSHLVPLFSRNHATINFFLARVVFPKEAKEFPSKLSCSGWDLAERKGRFVTGFSGTNDGQYLLPLHITQRDPDHQRGTNAKVLSYLLQPENNHYVCMSHENGKRRTTHEFLETLVAQTPEIRVLLDVGAQMLDLQNHELVKAWLNVFTKVSAAIYFSEDDELTVLTRDGRTHLLISSPFAQQLNQCIVYLDDAHTRGTDIRFPSGFRAAVTLGPSVTKDRLAQGCMRMRKLGHSHSLMFFVPLEIDRRIRSVANKGPLDNIDTIDILHWTICETLNDIRQRATHWAQQGMDHQTRYSAWSKFCAGELSPEQLTTKWLQPEIKSLVKLYAPHDASRSINSTIPEIYERCVRLGITSLHEGGMGEEQEREVIQEVEREREVERPSEARPANHSLSKDVVAFVKTGVIPNHSPAFHSVFTTLGNTSAVTNESHIWNRWILATQDFCQTIVPSGGGEASSKMDGFLRPVQWIISSQTAIKQVLVILSPHEVDRLLPHIRRSDHVHLHLYTPRTAKSMRPSDGLDLYNIPTVPPNWRPPQALMRQLNVFAGQLYLSSHEEYMRVCQFLCVYPGLQEDEEEMVVECDGFIMPEYRHGSPSRQHRTFQKTPLPFVKVLLGLRRKGTSFGQTHMGKILDGRVLTERDFESVGTAQTEVRLY